MSENVDDSIEPEHYEPMPARKKPRNRIVVKGKTISLTSDKVYSLAQSMLPVESIATILDITVKDVYDDWSRELRRGREDRKQSLVSAMWHKALVEKDCKMQIWLSKQHLGYRESMPEQATQVQFNVTCIEVPK